MKKSMAKKELKYNHHGRTSANGGEIKKGWAKV
jgi:hypothetical protein